MTDFLTSLVQRSFGPVAAIRPRVSSLFEPVGRPALTPADAAEPPDGHFIRETMPEPDDKERPGERAPVPSRTGTAKRLDAARIASEVPAPAAARHPFDAPIVPAPSPLDHQSLSHERPLPAPRLEERGDFTSRESSLRDSSESVVARANPSAVKAGAAGDGIVRQAAPSAHSTSVGSDESGLLVPPPISVDIAAEMQAVVSAWAAKPDTRLASSMERSTKAAAQSEPSVHVTIGRVEVRATTDGNVPVRRRPASPVMGLDEYLRLQARRGGQ